ncbi:hypothetical protein niasHS_010874 [Heterodera schachtii]|uniref:Uncharacterized protein n=2 Tax=Heterodera TaxID=34509 RepID=A0ABD2IXZ7_HETSC
MAKKTKYLIVRLASVISGTKQIWIRERAAAEAAAILYDPAIGKNVLFKEVEQVKGKDSFPDRVKKMYNIS